MSLNPLSWTFYELHDCANCGGRMEINGDDDTMEPKYNYNRRKYHDRECRNEGQEKQGWPAQSAGGRARRKNG